MSDFWRMLFGPEVRAPLIATNEPDAATPSDEFEISTKLDREDKPKWRRHYVGYIGERGLSIKISARTSFFGSGRSYSGEITQPGGRWILFDPGNVAEKILDPVLVPIIERFCAQVRSMDGCWVETGRNEFVDEAGVTWQRK